MSANVLDTDGNRLDWMAVFRAVDSALAGEPGGSVLTPPGEGLKNEAAEQVRGILETIERASWEDHIDDLVKPRLERLLNLLKGKETGK